MNPETVIFLRLTEATIAQQPEHSTEFQFHVTRTEIMEFCCGVVCWWVAERVWSRMKSRPAPWWKSGRTGHSRIQIADLPRHEESGDIELPVSAVRVSGGTGPSVW